MKKYDKTYFTSDNYKNYLDREDRYFKTAEELYQTFYKVGLINKDTKILDYGCAVGFLIKGLENIGLKNVFGYDISDWAIKEATKNNCKLIDDLKGTFEIGIFLDVLEHMTDNEILEIFKKVSFDRIIVRIPCSIDSEPNKFFLEVSRLDKTHINCKTSKQWVDFFNKIGYNSNFELNMSTIYNSKGCFCSIFIK